MPFKTHCFILTGEKEIEILLEITLRQHAVTATAPGLHPPLGTITEDPRSFGLVQISNNVKEAKKRSQTLQWSVKEIQECERCHTMYISFWSGVLTTVMYSAIQSWNCFDWNWSPASMPLGGIAVIFFVPVQPARKWRLKIQNRKIFIHPYGIKAWKRDATCLKSFQWQQCHRWRILQWFRSAILKKNSQETSQSNEGGWKTPRSTARPWEFGKNSKKKKTKRSSDRLACWKSLLNIITLNDRTYQTSKYP